MENDLVVHPSPSLDRIDDDRRKRSAGRDKLVPLPPEPPLAPRPQPSRESQHGLDWFIFFLADVQTGFGPFVAVYLTTQKWTQVEIGSIPFLGRIHALVWQMPGAG